MAHLINVTVDGREITVEQLADGTFRKPAYLTGAEREVIGFDRTRYRDKTTHDVTMYDDASTPGGRLDYERKAQITAPATPEAAQWEGWNTSLRPAQEPIIVARRPLTGTVAANVLAHGTGALNIDATRVATDDPLTGGGNGTGRVLSYQYGGFATIEALEEAAARGEMCPDARKGYASVVLARVRQCNNERLSAERGGRWPANVVLGHSPDCHEPGECAPECVVREMDEQSGILTSGKPSGIRGAKSNASVSYADLAAGSPLTGYGDSGGASRFFPSFRYQAKAPSRERPRVNGVAHPTTKPLELMKWLVRLVTPPGGTVLEPFAGSGTTVEASILEGFNVIAVEREPDYLPLIEQRIERAHQAIAARAEAAEKAKRPAPPRAPTKPKRKPAPAPAVDLPGQDGLFEVAG